MSLHILENEAIRVSVKDHGAELVSVYDKGGDAERMWNADPQVWNRHAPILFPFVGKVARGVYRCDGQEYEMKTQHGFARDMEFICVKESAASVTHCLKASEATRAMYPFEFELYVTHTLSGERTLKVQWEIRNAGQQKMYYSIGGHPGFCTPVREGEKREDYYLEFPKMERAEYILLNTSTGLALVQKRYRLELEDGFVPIAPDMFDKDALVFEGGQIEKVRIANPDKTPCVTLDCKGFPYVGIWSKPNGNFVCLEPWMGRTDNDGFTGSLEEKPGEQALLPGESRQVEYTIEFHELPDRDKKVQ